MESGRMPACNVVSLVGAHIASGDECLLQGENIKYYPSMQVHKGGNKCGHDKNSFKTPNFHEKTKRRPHVIEEAKRRIQESIASIYRYPSLTRIFFHCAEEEKSGRRRRSESLESALSLALVSCLHALSLQKMAIGFYDNRNTFHYHNYGYLETLTGLHPARLQRAMQVLQDEGILNVESVKEQNNDGSWRTKEVRIGFTDKIFSMLDLMSEFLKDRETIAIKFHEKQVRLDNNQRKRDSYRKPSFSSVRSPKTNKISRTLTPQLQTCIKRPPSASKPGDGVAIRDKINILVSKGFSVAEAMDLVRKAQAPPN